MRSERAEGSGKPPTGADGVAAAGSAEERPAGAEKRALSGEIGDVGFGCRLRFGEMWETVRTSDTGEGFADGRAGRGGEESFGCVGGCWKIRNEVGGITGGGGGEEARGLGEAEEWGIKLCEDGICEQRSGDDEGRFISISAG